jgi:hypothetical protein
VTWARAFPVLLGLLATSGAATAQNQVWIRQFGTSLYDDAKAVAPDGNGGVYLGGFSEGNLGAPNAGGSDVWVGRWDGTGTQVWVVQFGSSANETALAAVPRPGGGVFVAGWTLGSLAGTNAGSWDGWLAGLDAMGNQDWIRQLGTAGTDQVRAAAADGAGGVFVCGYSGGSLGGPSSGADDAWWARYDSSGNQTWIRQIGTSAGDFAYGAAPDGSGGLFVCGHTFGNLAAPNAGEYDAWLGRCDASGNLLWLRQWGTSAKDNASCAAPDGAGGVFALGSTAGALGGASAGAADGWLARFDGLGNQLWIRQLGSSADDFVYGAAPDLAGGVFLGGITAGNLGGLGAGGFDAWLAHYDGTGSSIWVSQLGTSLFDSPDALAPDGAGGVFAAGYSQGSLGGPNLGSYDAWLARYEDVCVGAGNYCSALVSSSGCTPALGFAGVPSLANPTGFSVTASNLENDKNGLLFFGLSGPNGTPFFGGTLCVQPALYRLDLKNSAGGAACTGNMAYTLADYLAHPSGGGLVGVGVLVHSQAWFRDPNALLTVGLSDGLQFRVCP